jgi:hypothetical protein
VIGSRALIADSHGVGGRPGPLCSEIVTVAEGSSIDALDPRLPAILAYAAAARTSRFPHPLRFRMS